MAIITEDIISRKYSRIPWGYVTLIALLCSVGFIALYSAGRGDINILAMGQIEKFIIGFIAIMIIAVIDIKFIYKFSYISYLGGLALLTLVFLVGVEGGLGAQRWLKIGSFQFQPSEIAKIGLVLALAKYFHNIHPNRIRKIFTLFIPIGLICICAGLIFIQPNLGTAIITVALGAAIMFMAGVGWEKFVIAAILIASAAYFVVWPNMHEYQKNRVLTFLNPESDPQGKGYNIIQSKISIGSGGMEGKGLLQGTQSQLQFVPEAKTDFIFSIIAEEFGFIGSSFLIFLFFALIMYGFYIGARAVTVYGKLLAYGVTTFIFIHAFINIGMVMGLLPVVGIPLPLVSYGGSNLLSTLLGLALVVNVNVHRKREI